SSISSARATNPPAARGAGSAGLASRSSRRSGARLRREPEPDVRNVSTYRRPLGVGTTNLMEWLLLWNGSAMRTCPRAALSRPVRSGGTDGRETGLTSRPAHRARPRARTARSIGNRLLPLRAALVVRLQRLDNGQHLVGGEQHRRGGRLLDRQVAVLGGVDLRCECSVDGRAHVYAPFRRARQ